MCCYENKWLLVTKNRNFQKACLSGNPLCFIDVLCAINGYPKFDKNYMDISSSELKLKKEDMITFGA